MNLLHLRIGEGWDVHALVPGRPLLLGGVPVPHSHGLLGHSDADVLLHAITDAVLGAAALGDIGRHFPDTDAQFYGASSVVLLAEAMRRVRAAGFELINLDSTIVAQKPKLARTSRPCAPALPRLWGLISAKSTSKPKPPKNWAPWAQGIPWKRGQLRC